MNINYELYRIFYYVVLNGSISKAAEALFISQPAVTQAINTGGVFVIDTKSTFFMESL